MCLAPEEVDAARAMRDHRAVQFLGGRIALRRAMSLLLGQDLASSVAPVLRDHRGAPLLPSDTLRGSISHKDQVAVALACAPLDPLQGAEEQDHNARGLGDGAVDATASTGLRRFSAVGIDIENLALERRSDLLRRKILNPAEVARLGALASAGLTEDQEILLYFSLKESVYKAIDPFLERYVGFKEVEAEPLLDGTCTASVCATALESEQEPFNTEEAKDSDTDLKSPPDLILQGHWRLIADYALTAISARRVER